jgi:TolB-like protein/Tfp pilus assembly protein PilF
MPLANLSGDPKQNYFSDGLAAEIRSELARNELLQVAAQTSSNTFRDRKEDAKSIAKKLGVAFLLEGSVRRAGNEVKIVATLIDRTGFEKWSETFDRSMDNIFEVQSEIATAIATELSAQIDGGKVKTKLDHSITGGTKSVAAFDAYLRGKDLFESGADEASDRLALAKFDEAIAADSGYAAAHAARSRSLAVLANQYAKGEELRALYRDAVIAAKRAVRLAPKYAEAHSALGFALAFGQMDMRAAREPYETSLKLGGGDADILSRYAIFVSRSGKFPAADKAIRRSLALDPLNARTHRTMGVISYSSGRYAEAVTDLQRCLDLNPTLGGVKAVLGAALLMQGKIDEAKAAFAAEKNSLFSLPGLAIIARQQGDTAAAQAALDRLISEHGNNGLYQQAQVYAQWGDKQKAMAALLAAREEGDSGLIQMYNDPLLVPVRKEPEFSRLLSDIGFV